MATMPDATPHDPSAPAPLAVAIICMNNEDSLPRTLDSVKAWAAEIVAVDSGSSDGTIPLLEAAGARVVHQPWLGHVRQKQHAMDLCAQRWILHLDSDESVEPDLAESIRTALAGDDPDIAAYRINRKVWYRGRLRQHAWQPEWRTRRVRRALIPDRIRSMGADPHQRIDLVDPGSARIENLAGTLRHDTIGDLAGFLERQVRLAGYGARSLHARSARTGPIRLLVSPAWAIAKQVVLKSAWRDGWRRWVAAGSAGLATLAKHLMALDLQHDDDR